MENTSCSASAVIGAFVLFFLILGITFAIYPGWDTVGVFLEENLKLSSEAPAWIQAFGSLGAIYSAIWLATSSERSEKVNTLIKARAFASMLYTGFGALKIAAEANNPSVIHTTQGMLQESLLTGREVKIELLPQECIRAVVTLRSIAGSILMASHAYLNNPTSDAAKKFKMVLDSFNVILLEHVVELSKSHSGLAEAK